MASKTYKFSIVHYNCVTCTYQSNSFFTIKGGPGFVFLTNKCYTSQQYIASCYNAQSFYINKFICNFFKGATPLCIINIYV